MWPNYCPAPVWPYDIKFLLWFNSCLIIVSFLGSLGHNFWLYGGMQEMGIYMYGIYWRAQMDLNLHTQNMRLNVRCLSTRPGEPTHTHIHNKSQGILSKRSAEPGQTEGDGQAQGQSQWGSFRHSSSHPFTVIQPLPWLRSPPQEVFVAHISELLVGHYSPLMPRPIVLQNICWSLSNIVDVIMAVAAEYDHISLRGWWR